MCKAVELFTKNRASYNCSQAVAAEVGEEKRDIFTQSGCGNAPGGVCGALYAAIELTSEECHDKLRQEFVLKVKSELCTELKKVYRVSCVECVQICANLLKKYRI